MTSYLRAFIEGIVVIDELLFLARTSLTYYAIDPQKRGFMPFNAYECSVKQFV